MFNTIKVNAGQWMFIVMAIMIATMPFIFTHKVAFLLNRASIVLTVLIWITQLRPDFSQIAKNKLLFSFLAIYLLTLISIFYSSNLKIAISSAEKGLPLLVFPLVILTVPGIFKEKTVKLFRFFTLAVTAASIVCLGYAFHRNNYFEGLKNPNWFYFSYYDLTEVINIQPIYLSLFVGFSIFLLTSDLLTRYRMSGLLKKSIIILWIVYLFVFLIFLAGKASIIATFLILIVGTFLFFASRKKYWSAVIFVALIIGVSISTIYQLPVVRERFISSFGLNKTSDWVYGDPNKTQPDSEARLIKWKASIEIIKSNWLIGVGTGDVQSELNLQYEKLGFQLGIDQRFNAHNQYLQTSIGLGIIGLLTFLGTILTSLKESIRTKNYLYTSFIVFFALNCITESLLERQYGIILYSLFSCLFFVQGKSMPITETQLNN